MTTLGAATCEGRLWGGHANLRGERNNMHAMPNLTDCEGGRDFLGRSIRPWPFTRLEVTVILGPGFVFLNILKVL